MSLATNTSSRRFSAADFVARYGVTPLAMVGALHLSAFAVMAWFELFPVSKVAFVLIWGFLNCFFVALLRRPGIAAALSLLVVALITVLSEFKHQVLWMTLNFLDIMIIDADSISFLFTIFPHLYLTLGITVAVTVPLLVLIWRIDPWRHRRRTAAAGAATFCAGIVSLSLTIELESFEAFYGGNHVSNFTRSGVIAVSELITNGMLESDAATAERLNPATGSCAPTAKPPHIILVHDESSFDIRSAPGVDVPPGYGAHFKSFDGKARKLMVEGIGGASWYAEYNVLTGLSARSFGRFSYFVTRIASGRVTRGLPNALRHCGYQTFSLYPSLGAFMSARSFQQTTGMQRFSDAADLGAKGLQPDRFFYDKAARLIQSERGKGPMFLFVYLAANHFPWSYPFRPELTPQWLDLKNQPNVNEYLRRQTMSARDYANFLNDLKQNFPGESFLIVRYGDHQPDFAAKIMDPSLDEKGIAQRLMRFDPAYFTTYYAVDAVNYKPADLSSALDRLDAPYLPLLVQEAAGLPLDPSFTEQKSILKRCRGLFYACKGGAEARRFNRLLIDAGLIKQL